MPFFVASEFPVLIEISFKVLRILVIIFYSELWFRWSCTLSKACEIFYKILLKSISFDQILSIGITGDGISLTGATHKSASPCFDHNFLLRTPISMILYSLEILWNCLQDSAKVHLIWLSLERRLNRCLSEGPVQGHRKNRCYWFLHNSSNSAFLWVLSSYFALLTLFNTFLGSRKIHLTNLLVLLIALSYNY